MATRKKGPARWLLNVGVDNHRAVDLARRGETEERNAYLHAARAKRLVYLKNLTRDVRKYYTNFDPSHGYNLSDIKSWSAQRVNEVLKYGEHLRQLQSQPHDRIRPRNKKQRRGLESQTGQTVGKRQKAFLVHKSSVEDVVSIDKNGVISIKRILPGTKGFLKSDFYLFDAYLGGEETDYERPVTWDDLYNSTVALLPHMPAGDYIIYSELHGEIDTPHDKRDIAGLILGYGTDYSPKDFARTIIGFKRISDEIVPNAEYARIAKRRAEYKIQKKKRADRLYKQMRRH